MKSVIRQMFLNERGLEQVPLSKPYRDAETAKIAVVDAFLEKLNEEQKKLFDEAYMRIMGESFEYAADHFAAGFKFGLLMGLEAANDSSII